MMYGTFNTIYCNMKHILKATYVNLRLLQSNQWLLIDWWWFAWFCKEKKEEKKSSNVPISTSIGNPPPYIERNAFFWGIQTVKVGLRAQRHKTTGSQAIVSFFFSPFIFLLRRGYVHGVTFSQINLDVLEAGFTCI